MQDGTDDRLREEMVSAVLAAGDRGVPTIAVLVTVAASLGTILGDNAQSVADMRTIAKALGAGIQSTAEKVLADRLDKR